MCDSHNLGYKIFSFVTTIWASSQENTPSSIYLDDEGCLSILSCAILENFHFGRYIIGCAVGNLVKHGVRVSFIE